MWTARVMASTGMILATVGLTAFAEPAVAGADVCGSVGGRHVSVNACGNVADAVAPWVPPPAAYAPLPEDYQAAPPPPPPPPPPNVTVCANVGRRISVSGCI